MDPAKPRLTLALSFLCLGLGLGAQTLQADLSFLGKPFAQVLASRGSPSSLGREAGFLDARAIDRFFGTWFDYWLSCDDRYSFSSPLLLSLAAQVSASPIRRGFVSLGYGTTAYWVDETGLVAALAYDKAPQGLAPGSPKGRLEGFLRYDPPGSLGGCGDLLVREGDGKGPGLLIFAPTYLLPQVHEVDLWGLPDSGQGTGK